MPRHLLPFFLIALLACGCDALYPNPQATITNTTPPPDTTARTGAELYSDNCGTCHKPDGSPVDESTILDLRGYDKTYQQFDSVMLSGPGAMPIFPYTELDSAERMRIYEHLKTFR